MNSQLDQTLNLISIKYALFQKQPNYGTGYETFQTSIFEGRRHSDGSE